MWYRILSFLRFYWRAVTEYNVQAPFLYDFVTVVLDTSKEYYAFKFIEDQRKRFKTSATTLPKIDFGAGSYRPQNDSIKVKDIASTALSNPTKCRILFNIINHYQCKNVLELGTSLGISSSYIAAANLLGRIVTCEGNPHIAEIAHKFHQEMGFHQVEIIMGPFKETLPKVLLENKQFDFVFIDGHHSEKPTIEYFETLLKNCHNDSVLVIDDIYWSEGMTRAWKTIVSHPEVTLSIDLYDIGVVFLKKELSKQDISFLTYKYKPWKIGVFG